MTKDQGNKTVLMLLIGVAVLISLAHVRLESDVTALESRMGLVEAGQKDHQQLDKVELTVPQSRTARLVGEHAARMAQLTKEHRAETNQIIERAIGKQADEYQATITAYCPCAKCCGKFADGITASGLKAKTGMIAADKSIPFGTKVWIDGIGDTVVQDRGGAIKGKHFDVYCDTHQAALEIGRSVRRVRVYR